MVIIVILHGITIYKNYSSVYFGSNIIWYPKNKKQGTRIKFKTCKYFYHQSICQLVKRTFRGIKPKKKKSKVSSPKIEINRV